MTGRLEFFARHAALSIVAAGLLSACVPSLPLPRYGTALKIREDRQILVTFQDRTIDRIGPASPVDSYRAHLPYGADEWRTHNAEALAIRHRLQLVTLWPITVLGVTCGVYAVPPERPISEVLETLEHDPGVEQAQPMQRFRPL